VADLGSGDGRIVITAARKHGARGLGIELDEKLARALARQRAPRRVAERVQFVQGDVLLADFSQASVVTVYSCPS
jgi:tRNA1(Val) A37 N6-methylase TrmN6